MKDLATKIALIEEEIRKTPYHKGTEHHIGRLKARLAKLRSAEEQQWQKTGGRLGFAVKKSGDATVVLVGPPSAGKSTLLNKLTEAQSRVAPWPFTTVTVVPGMMELNGAKIQIFDLPGIIGGAAKGLGRGREALSVARTADLLLLLVDVKTKNKLFSVLHELRELKISLPVLVAVNKVDLLKEPYGKINADQVLISAEKGLGLEELRQAIWQKLGLLRIYLKPKGKNPDFRAPLILKNSATVEAVAKKTFPPDKEISQIFLWGPSSSFPGQQISLNHQLKDGDILSFS